MLLLKSSRTYVRFQNFQVFKVTLRWQVAGDAEIEEHQLWVLLLTRHALMKGDLNARIQPNAF